MIFLSDSKLEGAEWEGGGEGEERKEVGKNNQ
jgi:hypothetical protein